MTVHPNDFPTALSELDRISETRKIPNALLFTGLPGSGKKQAAYRFAKAVNCAGKRAQPCNQCRSCRKINTNQHPDMIVVAPAKSQKTVLISQIREMIARTGTRPHEASYRMVLITEAGQMNPQAQNALLKELEEPPEKLFHSLGPGTVRTAAHNPFPVPVPAVSSIVRISPGRPSECALFD